jgi:UDP-glucose 4-epimerase
MKSVITGGGFIATFLANELTQRGHEVAVYGLERVPVPQVRFVEGDIRDMDRLFYACTNADVIFHLAGILGTDSLCDKALDAVDVNLRGAIHVFEAAKQFHCRVINVGLIPQWDNSYMITKNAASSFGKMYHREFGADILTVQLTHAYGPFQRTDLYRKAIPSFIIQALQNLPIEIYGNGHQIMDCIYAADAAVALRLIAECKETLPPVLQLGSGQKTTVAALAQSVINLTASSSTLTYLPMRPGEPPADNYAVSINCTIWQERFGWTPGVTLQDGLTKTISWYKDRLVHFQDANGQYKPQSETNSASEFEISGVRS